MWTVIYQLFRGHCKQQVRSSDSSGWMNVVVFHNRRTSRRWWLSTESQEYIWIFKLRNITRTPDYVEIQYVLFLHDPDKFPRCIGQIPSNSYQNDAAIQKKRWNANSADKIIGPDLWWSTTCHGLVWYMGVSKNRCTPKWMVYNGKPYKNGWFGGTIIFGNTHIYMFIYTFMLCGLPNKNPMA